MRVFPIGIACVYGSGLQACQMRTSVAFLSVTDPVDAQLSETCSKPPPTKEPLVSDATDRMLGTTFTFAVPAPDSCSWRLAGEVVKLNCSQGQGGDVSRAGVGDGWQHGKGTKQGDTSSQMGDKK